MTRTGRKFVVPELVANLDVKDPDYDCVIVVTDKVEKLVGNLECLKGPVENYAKVDTLEDVVLIQTDVVPSRRLIWSPTGPLDRDYDDVRRFYDAGLSGLKKALKAGSKKPLLVRPIDNTFPEAGKCATLGALEAAYVPLEIREDVPARAVKVEKIGIWCDSLECVNTAIKVLNALEIGRIVTRDIGGTDPERMAAPRAEEYVRGVFKNTNIKVEVISDVDEFKKNYPLLAAVNRAARMVPRHQGRLIYLTYEGEGPIEKTLFLVGKGITYDTGGADIKAGGIMAGMHRDKCGAATVAGFFKTLSELKPKGIKVFGSMSMVRNSVGSECYVADEIITSRAGVRVRVGNTDAEGRMVMADVLCRMKEKALTAVNPQLFTIATLTGHAIRAYGPHYSIIMDNGPARRINTSSDIQAAGNVLADPFEISTIRRDDYEFHKGKSEYEDVLQCNNQPSSATARGHQSPAAFLIMASGLDQHGNDSKNPLPYSHLDIAGSSGPFPGVPTASPLLALAGHFILPRA